MRMIWFLILPILLLIACSSAAASSYKLTVQTNKPSYFRKEYVCVYGRLTYNDWPIQQQLVTVSVRNPLDRTIFYGTNLTDTNGRYNVTFRLSNETELGTYTVRVNEAYAGSNYTTFQVTKIPGDVNDDGKVDLVDVYRVEMAYGSYPGHPRWDPDCDMNGDLKIGLIDYYTVTKNYGRTS
jgi:hypothetical protein